MLGISVIICCYNSEKRLPETLQYLAKQIVPGDIPWEIIVIDNASTDETKTIAFKEWERHASGVQLLVVEEPTPGLIYARQKGIDVAKYEFCLFCDDDNHLENNYIMNAYHIMVGNPKIGVAGGWSKPKLPFYPGKWIEDCYSSLAIGKQGENDGYVNWVFGAGMTFRKEILKELDAKNIKLNLSGRKGSKQTFGEDAEMCLASRFIGYKIYYTSKLVLYHAISAHRLTKRSFIKANYRNVYPVVYLRQLESLIKNKDETVQNLYVKLLKRSITLILHFLPRYIIGKHRFYSFIMLYQNTQICLWLIVKRYLFKSMYLNIKTNFYHVS